MELWDVYDREGLRTGKIVERDGALAEGEYHLIVHAWIRTAPDCYLISRRSPDKRVYPGFWEPTGGCVQSGESSHEAALRELREELGLRLRPGTGSLLRRFMGDSAYSPHLVEAWRFELAVEASELKLQAEEVVEARLASSAEIRLLLAEGRFVPDCLEYLEELFASA